MLLSVKLVLPLLRGHQEVVSVTAAGSIFYGGGFDSSSGRLCGVWWCSNHEFPL